MLEALNDKTGVVLVTLFADKIVNAPLLGVVLPIVPGTAQVLPNN